MTKPLKPSLRFISILPTIKIKEVIVAPKTVIWEVKLDKPVNIITDYQTIRGLNTFYIEAITLEIRSQGNGWHYGLDICITKNKGDVRCLIDLHEEEWYLKNTWWEWYKPFRLSSTN